MNTVQAKIGRKSDWQLRESASKIMQYRSVPVVSVNSVVQTEYLKLERDGII